MRSGMNLKSAKSVLSKLSVIVVSISLFVTRAEAQTIGHLGVSTDPIPLVQAKRPQPRYLARNSSRSTSRPDPSSKALLAEVGEGVNTAGKTTATNPTSSGTIAVVEMPKNSTAKPQPSNSTTPKPVPPTPVKSAVP